MIVIRFPGTRLQKKFSGNWEPSLSVLGCVEQTITRWRTMCAAVGPKKNEDVIDLFLFPFSTRTFSRQLLPNFLIRFQYILSFEVATKRSQSKIDDQSSPDSILLQF